MIDSTAIEAGIVKNLDLLSKFTSTPDNGVTRLPFSHEAREAVDYLKRIMSDAGLEVSEDCVGNVHGLLSAPDKNAGRVIIGSHYDSVKCGGKYDGNAGVVCGLEIIKLLLERVKAFRYSVELIAFNDEEGLMFGSGCLGSKAVVGEIDEKYINHLTDENGVTICEWMKRWGSDPKSIASARYDVDKIILFSEIHIEQGPVLDSQNYEIGIVDSIVGLLRASVTINGRADHAGTTPMDMRKDAIMAGAGVLSRLDRIVSEENNGSVGTCGFIRGYPNAMNIVSERVEFTLDIRSKYQESIDNIQKKLWKLIDKYTAEKNMTSDIDVKLTQKPVYMNKRLVESLEKSCEMSGIMYKKMVSGAAHDAMVFADKVPTMMLFVPSKDGRSHCRQEFSKSSDLVKAVYVAEKTIEKIVSM